MNPDGWGQAISRQGLLVFCSLWWVAGCGKRPEEAVVKQEPVVQQEDVFTSRANDKDYIATLMTNRQQQVQDAQAQVALVLKMTQCVTRVRATLPTEATDEALSKALAADAEWRVLEEQSQKLKMVAVATHQQAKDMVMRRMQEEMRAQQAIADGKARAIDGALAPKTTEKK